MKKSTIVELRDTIKLQNITEYDLVGVLDHQGTTVMSGHYVTKLKSSDCQWLLCNDLSVSPISFEDVISKDNYILLFKKKDTVKYSAGLMHKLSTGFMPLNYSVSNKEQKNNDGLVDDLEQQIQILVLKKNKTNEEKCELQKMKNRRKVQKCREKKTLEEKEAQKKQHREYMKATRGLTEPEEHKEMRKKQAREHTKAARGLTEPEEHKEMRKKTS